MSKRSMKVMSRLGTKFSIRRRGPKECIISQSYFYLQNRRGCFWLKKKIKKNKNCNNCKFQVLKEEIIRLETNKG
jgi:hypothetical protein